MQITAMVETVNAELRAAWQLEKRLPGGLNTGAYLVAQPNGDRAVLKWRTDDPERMLAAAPIVAAARARGWPTPAWLAVGTAPSGEAWVLQQFVAGAPPTRLDGRLASLMVEVFDSQAGVGDLAGSGWSDWAWGVVFEDWHRLRAKVSDSFPRGREVVAAVDAIAASCPPEPLGGADLVHGNFNITNTVLAGDHLWMIDVETVGGGTRAYDVAEALIVSTARHTATEAGSQTLWSCADTIDERAFAVCAASIALSFADAVIRHGQLPEAPDMVPDLLKLLAKLRGGH